LLLHPELPSCQSCIQFLHSKDWKIETNAGAPVPRPAHAPPPCFRCPKIPKGKAPKPSNAAEISDKNYQAYRYYQQCVVDATALLPRDRIVVNNNAIIRSALDFIEMSNLQTLSTTMQLMSMNAFRK
jgi:hypothetical protein